MAYVPLITVAYDGGYYSPKRDVSAPIRIYPDRWIEDDIAEQFTGCVRRERLSRKEFSRVRKCARQNRARGDV